MYANDAARCYMAVVGRVVYIMVHVREVRYRVEREYIQEEAAEDTLAGYFLESGFR